MCHSVFLFMDMINHISTADHGTAEYVGKGTFDGAGASGS
jgi:hypothetical protein